MLMLPARPFIYHGSLQLVMQKSQNGASRQSSQNLNPQVSLARLDMKKLRESLVG